MNYLGSHSRGLLGVPDEVVASIGGGGVTWDVDADSGVDMPINATQYADWVAANTFTNPFPVPGAMFRYNEASGVLNDAIGSATIVKTGTATYASDVPSWATNGVKLPYNSGADWFTGPNAPNQSTTAYAVFMIALINSSGNVTALLCMDSATSGNRTQIELDATNKIGAYRSISNSASSAAGYAGVVGVFAVVRPASSQFKVYIKQIGGSVETLTPDPSTATQSDVDGHDTSRAKNGLSVAVHGPPAGSVDTSRTRRSRRLAPRANAAEQVVLPTPPLPPKKTT